MRFLLSWCCVVAALWPSVAEAFCRSSTCATGTCQVDDDCAPHEACTGGVCNFQGKICVPAEPDDCGIPLYWAQPCISWNMQEAASEQVSLKDASVAMRVAFDTWVSADCGGGNPSIEVDDLGPVTCAAVEYNQKAGNANIVMFRDAFWPDEPEGPHYPNQIALTTVTYDVDTGAIYDADLEVNTANFQLSLGGSGADLDLQAVLTHEAGHFLGLDHSPVPDATMTTSYSETAHQETLASDDVLGICSIYPVGREVVGACDSLPRHGFSSSCAEEQIDEGCSLSPAPSAPIPGAVALLLVCASMPGVRRRRRLT